MFWQIFQLWNMVTHGFKRNPWLSHKHSLVWAQIMSTNRETLFIRFIRARTSPKIIDPFTHVPLFFLFQVVGVISVFFIVVSIVSFCLKTHPDMRVPVIRNITVRTSANTTAWTLDKYQTNAHEAFFFVECVCNAWFSIEIIMRFISCPNKLVFLRTR